MFITLLFLSSGLFLGWSLGANDAANVFGTAVGSKMIRFRTAALVSSIFVIIGATIGGAGAAGTLGELGQIHQIAGAFAVALSAALAVFFMTKAKVPVSTSQAIVGGIIGWNIFSGNSTDAAVISKIVSTWLLCPLLAAFFAFTLYFIAQLFISKRKINIIKLDSRTRLLLLAAGAFGSYSLGANNIANVMGVFIPSNPFKEIHLASFIISPTIILFFIGGIAISVGIFTYSKRVMLTVGKDLFKLSPIAAFIAVLSHSLVLFIFSSQALSLFLNKIGLPSIPLVPVSSSQAIVGAVIGIGLAKGGGNFKFLTLGKICLGWVITPLLAAFITFISLFILKNLFLLDVI